MIPDRKSSIPIVLDIVGAIIIVLGFVGAVLALAESASIIISAAIFFAFFATGILFFGIGKIIDLLQDSVNNQTDILLKLNQGVQRLEYLSWNGRINK